MPARSPERFDAAGVGEPAQAFARDLEPDGRLLERELRSGAGLRRCGREATQDRGGVVERVHERVDEVGIELAAAFAAQDRRPPPRR